MSGKALHSSLGAPFALENVPRLDTSIFVSGRSKASYVAFLQYAHRQGREALFVFIGGGFLSQFFFCPLIWWLLVLVLNTSID